MRRLLSLLLVASAAVAQGKPPRSVAQILNDHAVALGGAKDVRTLRATAKVGDGRQEIDGAIITWKLPSTCLREIPTGPGQHPWREYFTPEGAFLSKGYFERYRPNQETTRGGYYFLKGLAEPFPLLAYVNNPAAQKGLRVGQAALNGVQQEVLFTRPDDHGVRTVYLLDPETHLIRNIRFEAEENKPFANITHDSYAEIQGVKLPHSTYAIMRMLAEDPEKRRLSALNIARHVRITKWEVDPAVEDFKPPGLRQSGGKEFARKVFATGPDPHEVAVGDLDQDGKNDFAVACEAALYVHFGGAESRPVRVPLGRGHTRGVVIDDFDVDGRPDVITTSNVQPAQTMFVISFDAQRNPTKRSTYGAPHFTYGLKTDDFDLDGIPDVVLSGYESRDVGVKFGSGSGTVRLVGAGPYPLALKGMGARRGLGLDTGWVDGDVIKDIAVADGARVVVFQGQQNLSFKATISIPERVDPDRPWRPVDVAITDLDNNGFGDLVVVRSHPFEDLQGDVVVVLNDGQRLDAKAAIDAGARVLSVATGNFNRDAFPDVVVTSFLTGEISFLYGDGKGGLSKPERYSSGRGTSRVAVADYDGDLTDDVVATNRLDDTVSVFTSRGNTLQLPRAPPERAVECAGPTKADFKLEGLADPYDFAGEFRLPAAIADPSGIACLGGVVNTQFLFVSDKRPAMFRGVLDRSGKRFLAGPPIPLLGLELQRLDLEAVAFDRDSGNVFLACEADSTIVRATIFGQVLARAATKIESNGNDGIEALSVRRLKDGTPLLYVFKERIGKTLQPPPIHVYGMTEDPFELTPRNLKLTLPLPSPDQTGAAILDDRLFVVMRFAHGIVQLEFEGDGFAKKTHQASYRTLVNDQLQIRSHPLYGNVEGITVDPTTGDLFLLVDNNSQMIGQQNVNRGKEGRLLWFRNRAKKAARAAPRRVRLKQVVVPRDAKGADGVALSREELEKRARAILREAEAGEEFERLAAQNPYERLPAALTIVAPGERRTGAGKVYVRGELPRALERLAFNLRIGEVGLCEFHEKESPYGWHVVLRVE